MAQRYVVQFPGSVSAQGMQKIDQTPAELDVANIASLRHVPGLNEWDTVDGFKDRNTDNPIASYGVANAQANYVIMINGKRGYKVTTSAQGLTMPVFNTAGSFTIACVADVQLAFGSITEGLATPPVTVPATPAPWNVYSNLGGSGAITVNFGNQSISEATTGAWPKKLSAAKLTAVTMIFDRAAGKLTFRYDQVEIGSITNEALKTITVMPEVNMGIVRVAGAGAAIATRPMVTNTFLAFESALAGEELAAVERMTMAAAAAA